MSPSPPLLREPPSTSGPSFSSFFIQSLFAWELLWRSRPGFRGSAFLSCSPPQVPHLAIAIFFSSASPVVYPAGGCDVRDAQQQKITTSPSATRWPLARALFIYLFRDAGGGGRQPKGATSRCRSLSGVAGGLKGAHGEAWARRGAGAGWGASRGCNTGAAREGVPSGGIYCYLLCGSCTLCSRPGPRPRVRVCARVCAGECVSGGRARAGVGARGERPPKTP